MVNIYALINPINDEVFYIGATKDCVNRLCTHRSDTHSNLRKTEIIKSIKDSGLKLEMMILDECYDDEVRFWEEFYIDLYSFYGFDLKQSRTSLYNEDGKPHISMKNDNGYDIYTLYSTFRGEEIIYTLKQSELCISNTSLIDKLYFLYYNRRCFIKARTEWQDTLPIKEYVKK